MLHILGWASPNLPQAGVGLRLGQMTSGLLHVTDKVAPCGYLFNQMEALVDAPLEQELGGLPMTPKEQAHFFVVFP